MVETLLSCTSASCTILKLFILVLLPMLVASAVTLVVKALERRRRDARE